MSCLGTTEFSKIDNSADSRSHQGDVEKFGIDSSTDSASMSIANTLASLFPLCCHKEITPHLATCIKYGRCVLKIAQDPSITASTPIFIELR